MNTAQIILFLGLIPGLFGSLASRAPVSNLEMDLHYELAHMPRRETIDRSGVNDRIFVSDLETDNKSGKKFPYQNDKGETVIMEMGDSVVPEHVTAVTYWIENAKTDHVPQKVRDVLKRMAELRPGMTIDEATEALKIPKGEGEFTGFRNLDITKYNIGDTGYTLEIEFLQVAGKDTSGLYNAAVRRWTNNLDTERLAPCVVEGKASNVTRRKVPTPLGVEILKKDAEKLRLEQKQKGETEELQKQGRQEGDEER